ncbi:MAG: class III poly(R)-hydroxyalkanoic acid synthase subunit PhaC [Magnetococcales bacterium]|nr:class III poly(R)-hydroxyalkanoic acid synthase subunit PhaC [Magnetococcales bacterium]
MIPILNNPDRIVREVVDFNQKLAQGLENLSQISAIDVGASQRETIYTEDKMVLCRFTPLVEKPFRIPVLVVYALVNRPYMADLQKERSMIRRLLEQGMDVYLIDWGYPDEADRFLSLDDYINGYIRRSVGVICERHGLSKINLLGICQGGTFSLCFSALHPDKVRNLVTMVTPVDFHAPGNLLSHWAQNLDVDLMVNTLGNIPGEMLNLTFLALKPFRLTAQKYLDLVQIMDDRTKLENFLCMEKWIFDSPDQVGEAFRQFIKDFYQRNGLVKGEVTIGNKQVKLSNISMPVLNVFATEDHLVPPEASTILGKLVGTTDYTEMAFKGGHIGIYVSGRAQKEIPTAIVNWFRERE